MLLRMAPLGMSHRRWLPQAAWEKATASEKPGLALKPAGPGRSGAWGSHVRWFPKLQSSPRCALVAQASARALQPPQCKSCP